MNEGEYKSTVTEVSDWVWGVVRGGFNEQQTVSQIIVDAAIGMIPLVGDVTAARDLMAVVTRLWNHPDRREDKMEWAALVITAFALIPGVGGAIKGVGRLLIHEAHNATALGKLIKPIVDVLNRVGHGDAVQFLKKLDLIGYASPLQQKVRELFTRLDKVIGVVLRRASWIIPYAMVAVLKSFREALAHLTALVDRMIPEALKDLHERMKLVQRAVYEGELHEIRDVAKYTSREREARLVETITGDTVRKGGKMRYPPNEVGSYVWPRGPYPNLRNHVKGPEWIRTFHGEMRPVVLEKGTTIYRVVDDKACTAGAFWFRELPADGGRWREGCAVLEDWNKDRWYVEMHLEHDVYAYEGVIASQLNTTLSSKTYGQYLEGGSMQLLIDFRHSSNRSSLMNAENLTRTATGWPPESHLNVNVPSRTVAIEQLDRLHIEDKVHGAAVITRGETSKLRSEKRSEEHAR